MPKGRTVSAKPRQTIATMVPRNVEHRRNDHEHRLGGRRDRERKEKDADKAELRTSVRGAYGVS